MTPEYLLQVIAAGEGLHTEFKEARSGVRNINKYLPLYAKGAKPEFWEKDHGFTLILPLGAPTSLEDQARSESGVEVPVNLRLESRRFREGCLGEGVEAQDRLR